MTLCATGVYTRSTRSLIQGPAPAMPASMSMFHATTFARSPERNFVPELELSPWMRSRHQGTSHRFVVLNLYESLSCRLTNLSGAFNGTIKDRHCHSGHICSRNHSIKGQLRIATAVTSVSVLAKDSSVDPMSLAKEHRGSYYLILEKLKGSRNCLRLMRNERRKMKVMKRSRKSEETLTSCMDEVRQILGHLEPCDVCKR